MENNANSAAAAAPQQASQQQKPMTFEDKVVELRTTWTAKIEELNGYMKSPATLDHLMNVIFLERQQAVNLYYGTKDTLDKQLRVYKAKYAGLYNQLKQGKNGIRYTNESAIQTQIEAELAQDLVIINELKNLIDFMWETVKSIDGIQYSINNKIKVYEILEGLKV